MDERELGDLTPLLWRVKERPGYVLVKFSGDLDENADFRDLLPRLKGSVVFNLAEVERINSCGIREWVTFMRGLPGLDDLAFTHCSLAFVTQLNLIHNFRGNARIESFYAPYACETCNGEYKVLLTVETDFADGNLADVPEWECPHCTTAWLTLDESPVRYLQFLRDIARTEGLRGAPPRPDLDAPEGDGATGSAGTDAGDLSATRSEVERIAREDAAARLFQTGQNLLKEGACGEADELFRKAAEMCPDRGDYLAHHGWALFCAMGGTARAADQALPILESAAERAPLVEATHLLLGRVYERVGRREQAVRQIEKALAANPGSVDATRELERLKSVV